MSMSVTQAARSGSQLDLLVALRERIAKTVEDETCAPRDLASLSLRLTQINKEIEALQELSEDERGTTIHGQDSEVFDPSTI